MGVYLIWVRAFDNRLMPQKVFGEAGEGRPDLGRAAHADIVQWIELTEDEVDLSLNSLSSRHPPPLVSD